MKKTRATRKMMRDRLIRLLPIHIQMTLMIFHWVPRLMIGGIESSTDRESGHNRWMRRSKHSV